jgi:serine/threonine protein kinase
MRSMGSNGSEFSAPADWRLTASTAEMTGQAGSYAYMAPEVLRNEEYDEMADIYSFGVMTYNMFYKIIPTVLIALNGTDEDVVLYAWKVRAGFWERLAGEPCVKVWGKRGRVGM